MFGTSTIHQCTRFSYKPHPTNSNTSVSYSCNAHTYISLSIKVLDTRGSARSRGLVQDLSCVGVLSRLCLINLVSCTSHVSYTYTSISIKVFDISGSARLCGPVQDLGCTVVLSCLCLIKPVNRTSHLARPLHDLVKSNATPTDSITQTCFPISVDNHVSSTSSTHSLS